MRPEHLEHLSRHAPLSTDPGVLSAHAIDDWKPAAVLFPGDEAELAAALSEAVRLGLKVAPRGGGTKAGLGAPPAALDAVIATARLDGIIAYEPADLTVTVQSGITLSALSEVLAREGQALPLDPPYADRATIGGVVAAAAHGPRRLAYGSVRDLVLGLQVALADGRLIRTGGRVVKNVAGYDMNKLFVGSLGTLGIITEVTLKVRPLPEAAETLVAGFDAPGPCLACAEAILASELLPVAVTVLTPGASRTLAASGPCALLVALEESAPNVRYQRERIAKEVGLYGGTAPEVLTGEAEQALWEGVRHYADRSGAAIACRISTLPSRLEQELDRALQAARVPADAILHPGTGQLFLYGQTTDDPDALRQTAAAWLAPAEGTAVLERGPASLRRKLPVWGDPGPAFPLMAGLKRSFDPTGALNPGRFVGGL